MNAKLDMSGLAERSELSRYKWQNGSVFLGRLHADHGINAVAGIADDRHLVVQAGSRGGKGVSFIIPNLIEWQGGAVVIDPKGEAASITAVRRGNDEQRKGSGSSVKKTLGGRVAILDPMGVVRGAARSQNYRVNYDPMTEIDITGVDAVNAIETMVEGIVTAEQGGSAAHFSDTAATILAGVIEAVLIGEPKERHSLPFVRKVIAGGSHTILAALDKAENGYLAPAALGLIDDVGDNEMGSISSTLGRNLKWLSDPRIQSHMIGGSFSLRQAVCDGWTVYICIPPRMIPRFSRWLRLIVNVAFDAKMSTPLHAQQGLQSLFILDEFAALGHFKLIEDAAAYMAGYGIKLVPIIQNIGQIKKHYGQNWETFLANAGAILSWSTNDHETEEYISKRCGQIIVTEDGRSYSENFKKTGLFQTEKLEGYSSSRSRSQHERPVRRPSEIHYQAARHTGRAFVIPADTRPFTIERLSYFDQKRFRGLYDSPEAIAGWEKRFQERRKK